MRRFNLVRTVYRTSPSDIRILAEGAQFFTGQTVLHWIVKNKPATVIVFDRLEDIILLHIHEDTGHEYEIYIEWVDK